MYKLACGTINIGYTHYLCVNLVHLVQVAIVVIYIYIATTCHLGRTTRLCTLAEYFFILFYDAWSCHSSVQKMK